MFMASSFGRAICVAGAAHEFRLGFREFGDFVVQAEPADTHPEGFNFRIDRVSTSHNRYSIAGPPKGLDRHATAHPSGVLLWNPITERGW